MAVALAACHSQDDKSAPPPPPTASAPALRSASIAPTQQDLVWTMPQGWTMEPAGGMRKASYSVPKASGDTEDATVTVIQAGGSVDDNVERWKKQLVGAHDFSRSTSSRDGLDITLVEVHGTYTGGGVMVGESPNPRPGWALVGAIVTGAGPQPWFFKMIGPDKTVAAARHDFQSLVDSVHKK